MRRGSTQFSEATHGRLPHHLVGSCESTLIDAKSTSIDSHSTLIDAHRRCIGAIATTPSR
eukprot:2362357-Pyramimonas_sp.AAC.1